MTEFEPSDKQLYERRLREGALRYEAAGVAHANNLDNQRRDSDEKGFAHEKSLEAQHKAWETAAYQS